MSTLELRRKIKRAVDKLPKRRLESLADFVHFLAQSPLSDRLVENERAIASGKGVNWRKVRTA